jgi:hypothetical protein
VPLLVEQSADWKEYLKEILLPPSGHSTARNFRFFSDDSDAAQSQV